MSLKDNVRALCKKKGVTAQQVEIDLALGKGYISKLDKSTPNAGNLQKLADYLGVTTDYLLGQETKNSPDTESGEELPHRKYRQVLSEGGIRVYLDEDANVPQENLEDIIKYIKLRQRDVGR